MCAVVFAQLRHPNLVQFIDYFEDAEYCFLIMELMTGGELFTRIVEKVCEPVLGWAGWGSQCDIRLPNTRRIPPPPNPDMGWPHFQLPSPPVQLPQAYLGTVPRADWCSPSLSPPSLS